MHELRKNPLLGRWVAVSSDSKKPEEYHAQRPASTESTCILCAGREAETPVEIASVRGNGRWSARVIPNFKPVFQVEGDLGRRGVGMYDTMNSIGANELIIESPQHNVRTEDLGFDHTLNIIRLYRDRIADLERDARLRHMLIYKDSGTGAGAKFDHPYSELVATPVIPKGIKEELDGAKQYYDFKERCIFCDILRDEQRQGDRVIYETSKFIALSLFAPKFPFEFWIMPKKHRCAFQDIDADEMEDLSMVLSIMIKKVRKALNDPPYNYVIHTAPNRIPRSDHWHTLGEDYHWHIEIMPRLIRTTGFEWGSGFYVLTTSPEDATKYLREA